MGQGRTYVEFRVAMNVRTQSKSCLFVGLVDRTKYRPSQLTSTFWRDSPSSFYWDVWNNKLVKIDENGIQAGVAGGYGCGCQDLTETRIGVCYDSRNMTITYYKDGAGQGVAFHNVPRGLCPALDMWFEAGHVEVLGSSSGKPSTKEYL